MPDFCQITSFLIVRNIAEGVDTSRETSTEIIATIDGLTLIYTESQSGRLHEPGAVNWIEDTQYATANEGGSRDWVICHKDGTEIDENGAGFEKAIIQIGHYSDKRTDSKGVEPESLTEAILMAPR
ncbi:hypothetical protein [uncultured Ruegeria sp.]|uniref:hypothetical protein n=1 Tax=uncultured Ruegeria sp. TaxID=259304 RepID=UPI00262FC4C8|nr:hypothetical protein [uncultured Ruegeria sp.]